MDPTSQFFSKLRKLAVTLESETARLQNAFDNRKDDGDSGEAPENTTRGMRAYHELNSEVGNLKVQIQSELAEQKAQENEVSSFIKACKVMEQKVCKDIQTLRTHLEKYGYQAPIQRPVKSKDQEVEAADKVEEQDEMNTSVGDEGSQEEDKEICCSSAQKMELPFTNVMHTPQLSDFGLSELQLKRALAGSEWCSEVPPMPEMSLPHLSLNTPAPPHMAITPKCTLRMDDDELQTPQMHDFGISEHTMCLNNDFTMDLFQKNIKNTQRPPEDIPAPSMNSVVESLQTKVNNMVSPELPVLCTPGLKIKKPNGPCSPPPQSNGHPESPCCPDILPTTPEVPAFQTPYVNRLVSTKKSARQPEPIDMQTDDDANIFEIQTSPCNKAAGSKRSWEYNVPHISIFDTEDKQMPEMPNLESALGNSLQSRNGKILKMSETEKVGKDRTVNSLKLDGPTQEFSLGTPRVRTNFQEPSTPEMPDLSSVTQDICKLVSQAQMKKTATADIQPVKDKHGSLPQAESLSVVSQSEFQTLPNYLRRMNLSSLNQAVHNINRYKEEHQGEMNELTTEVLRQIINVGTMAPIYIICLQELKRLTQVDGVLGTAAYKLITHN
ncbi:spindle and kinetochore-associated protein 3 [Melanotaenia boesemani]|uniref:spindle and kinetochore-associated protein 3 n=1 Tax=Melanotaenia boesemani TaxID=1250792 RepID=UPI001C0475A9|nr:spindle and kinetochore-associated protein 3 [Melanotaenia boesemani]